MKYKIEEKKILKRGIGSTYYTKSVFDVFRHHWPWGWHELPQRFDSLDDAANFVDVLKERDGFGTKVTIFKYEK